MATTEADRITPRRPLAASDNRDAPPQQAIRVLAGQGQDKTVALELPKLARKFA